MEQSVESSFPPAEKQFIRADLRLQVVNKKTHRSTPYDVYIGRGSALGNPYTHLKTPTKATFVVDSVEEAVEKHREHLIEKISQGDEPTLKALNQIKWMLKKEGKVNLVCYCKPGACHGDTIGKIVLQAATEELSRELAQKLEAGYEQEIKPEMHGKTVLALDNLGREHKATYTPSTGWQTATPLKEGTQIIAFRSVDQALEASSRQEHKVTHVLHTRDYCVIKAKFATADGFETVKVSDLKKENAPAILFQGSPKECAQWRAAGPEQRQEIERLAEAKFREKLGVSKAPQFNIATPGRQAGLGL